LPEVGSRYSKSGLLNTSLWFDRMNQPTLDFAHYNQQLLLPKTFVLVLNLTVPHQRAFTFDIGITKFFLTNLHDISVYRRRSALSQVILEEHP